MLRHHVCERVFICLFVEAITMLHSRLHILSRQFPNNFRRTVNISKIVHVALDRNMFTLIKSIRIWHFRLAENETNEKKWKIIMRIHVNLQLKHMMLVNWCVVRCLCHFQHKMFEVIVPKTRIFTRSESESV